MSEQKFKRRKAVPSHSEHMQTALECADHSKRWKCRVTSTENMEKGQSRGVTSHLPQCLCLRPCLSRQLRELHLDTLSNDGETPPREGDRLPAIIPTPIFWLQSLFLAPPHI